jgi:RNA polymerase sigma-70 factor (sigma-E family)
VRYPSNPNGGTPAGDPEDFPAFVASRGTQLYRTACLLTCGDTHMAEDLVQETPGRMYTKWDRRRRIENPAGYAQTVLVNLFISMRRRRASTERLRAQPGETARATAAADGGDADLRVTLLAALRELGATDRAVLVLRFWEDRSIEDTAAALRLTPSAVRSRSFRALGRVRELLGSDFAEFAEN